MISDVGMGGSHIYVKVKTENISSDNCKYIWTNKHSIVKQTSIDTSCLTKWVVSHRALCMYVWIYPSIYDMYV